MSRTQHRQFSDLSRKRIATSIVPSRKRAPFARVRRTASVNGSLLRPASSHAPSRASTIETPIFSMLHIITALRMWHRTSKGSIETRPSIQSTVPVPRRSLSRVKLQYYPYSANFSLRRVPTTADAVWLDKVVRIYPLNAILLSTYKQDNDIVVPNLCAWHLWPIDRFLGYTQTPY